MAFSSDTKKEIERHLPKKECCKRTLARARDIFSEREPFAGEMDFPGSCCYRAFLKGAFLEAGSVSDPKKTYRLEISCKNMKQCDILSEVFGKFGIKGNVSSRKDGMVFYIKDRNTVSEALAVLEAPKASMETDNVMILRDVRNDANRQSNCDAGNIAKTVEASRRQIEEIRLIEKRIGLDKLTSPLREAAIARLEQPDVPLSELGEYLDPPVSKSCICHRMRRISEMAKKAAEE